jgi:hypothetical protein
MSACGREASVSAEEPFMDTGASVAVATAVSGVVSGAVASIVSIVRVRQERRDRIAAIEQARLQWEVAQQKDVADWQVQLLRELLGRRLATYPAVMPALGAAVYVYGHEDEIASREELAAASRTLFDALYGEAGLLMSPDARDAVQVARMACNGYLEGKETADSLIDSFWAARRALRIDVQALDLSFGRILADMAKVREGSPPKRTQEAPAAGGAAR